MTIWLLRTPYNGHLRTTASDESARLSLADAARTLRDISANRGILVMIALAGLSSLFVGNAFQAQMPAFAATFGSAQDEITYSVLLTASAAGSVLGGFGLEALAFFRQPRIRTAVLLALLWATSILVFAITPFYPIAVLALFVGGVLNIGFTSMAQAYVQLEAPPARRGRVVGLFSMSWNGLRVGSGVTVGILGAVIGIHSSLALSALAFLVVGVALLVYAQGRAREAVTA
jgi:MFS family permease